MVRRCVVFVWILQSFTIMRLAAIVNSQCEQALDVDESANDDVSLTCNTTHLLVNGCFDGGLYRLYYLGIDCFHDNGSESVAHQFFNGMGTHLQDCMDFELSHLPLTPGSECTLYGCYEDFLKSSFFKIRSAHCTVDKDECLLQTHSCSGLAFCNNTAGSYNCSCFPGYGGDGFNCTDIDECADSNQRCNEFAVCLNTPGSYNCSCLDGYEGNGFNCTDIDECANNNQSCSKFAVCTNTPGSYNCSCLDGYDGNGFNCTDVNECSVNASVCGINGTCVNTAGSYECWCDKGYAVSQNVCMDIDECSISTSVCGKNGTCVNDIGSYSCLCDEGYAVYQSICVDVNECSVNASVCGINGTCVNTAGSYECWCDKGYAVSQNVCMDIDECSISTSVCGKNGTCVNDIGSYSCLCDEGYAVYQNVCVAKDYSDATEAGLALFVAPLSVVILCLAIPVAILVTICIITSRKKHSWLHLVKQQFGEEELDMDFNPIDPSFILSGSLKSIIEPLSNMYKLPNDHTCQSSDDRSEPPSADNDSDTTGNTDGEHVIATNLVVSDTMTEESTQIQSSTYDFDDMEPSTCNAPDCNFQPIMTATLNFSGRNKDESGFISDTSSSVYLSFNQLSNKL